MEPRTRFVQLRSSIGMQGCVILFYSADFVRFFLLDSKFLYDACAITGSGGPTIFETLSYLNWDFEIIKVVILDFQLYRDFEFICMVGNFQDLPKWQVYLLYICHFGKDDFAPFWSIFLNFTIY